MADERSLIASLFTLIENSIFFGDRMQESEFVTMMSPGQFISPNLQEQKPNDAYIQYDVTNDCLDTSFIRKPLDATVAGKYEEIFKFRALPLKSLTADEQAKLAADKGIIDQLQSAYETYLRVYNSADGDYQAALQNPDTDPRLLRDLRDARDRAQRQLDSAGQQQKYESAYADFKYLQSADPRVYFQDLDTRRTNYGPLTSTRGQYFQTQFDPKVADWNTAGWTHAVLDTKTISSDSFSRSTQWGGGASLSLGLWHFGGQGGHSETYSHDHSEFTELAADLEYLRVRIMRPWLLPDVFGFRFWTWAKTHGFKFISDGGNLAASPPVRPIGDMPFLPAEMVVVRNVKLTANFTSTDNTIITSHVSGGASFGWGPFSISGSYSEDTSEQTFQGTYNNGTITIAQPQIIAFLGPLTPRSPDPDPLLPWQSDAAFPPSSMREAYVAALRNIRQADFIRNGRR
jgi:hypothetical protein